MSMHVHYGSEWVILYLCVRESNNYNMKWKCWSNYLWHFHINRNESRFSLVPSFTWRSRLIVPGSFQLLAAQIRILSISFHKKFLKFSNIFNYSLFLSKLPEYPCQESFLMCHIVNRLEYRQDVSLNWTWLVSHTTSWSPVSGFWFNNRWEKNEPCICRVMLCFSDKGNKSRHRLTPPLVW